MDTQLYRKFLNQYVQDGLQNSNGTVQGVYEYLSGQTVRGFLVRNKLERQRALDDARRAFAEHRHWPLEIVLSHLGVEAAPRRP